MSGPGDLDEGPSFSASSLISNPTPFDGGLLGTPFVFAKWGHGGLQCFLPADSSLIPQRWCKALAQKETSCFISVLMESRADAHCPDPIRLMFLLSFPTDVSVEWGSWCCRVLLTLWISASREPGKAAPGCKSWFHCCWLMN